MRAGGPTDHIGHGLAADNPPLSVQPLCGFVIDREDGVYLRSFGKWGPAIGQESAVNGADHVTDDFRAHVPSRFDECRTRQASING
ncbi:hypothetical protein G6F31_019075 [Rhizopus arrhizus]|nr:hypothetical protein G6F31_019075 [Rhizopus arrhizus]